MSTNLFPNSLEKLCSFTKPMESEETIEKYDTVDENQIN